MEEDKVYLKHILDAIATTEKYTKDVSIEEFEENTLIRDGVIRQIEIIGEAVKNLSGNFKESRKEVPWKDIAGMRDKLIHEYFGVDLDLVWETVKNDLPQLKKQITKMLKSGY